MLAYQLIQSSYPSLNLSDKVFFALQLMDDYDVKHLSVLSEEKFLGLVTKEDLLDTDENNTIKELEFQLIKASVKKEDHILTALKLATEKELSIIPVVNEVSELQGVITTQILLQNLSKYVGNDEPGGVIVLEIERRNYSFGEISRLIETNDAYITQLNTYVEGDTGLIVVTLKINKIEVSDVVATLQRYEYVVRYYFGEEQFANELKENYNHLMAYLNL